MISLLHVQHVAISQDIFGLPSPVPPVYKAWHNKLTTLPVTLGLSGWPNDHTRYMVSEVNRS